MSCVIRTATPFIERQFLLKALDENEIECQIQGERILLIGFAYRTYFEKDHLGKYILTHEQGTDIQVLLGKVEKSYEKAYRSYLKKFEEKQTELEKKALQAQQNQIIAQQKQLELERQKAEQEKQRIEQDRLNYLDKQKEAIKEKAREMGYEIKEVKKAKKVQLVLVRRSY